MISFSGGKYPNLYAIRVKKISNHLLIQKGWEDGDIVLRRFNEYSGDTFDRGLEVYDSYDEAKKEMLKREKRFRGVEFEVSKYTLV
jgi:hypothetical protein